MYARCMIRILSNIEAVFLMYCNFHEFDRLSSILTIGDAG
jgi:hypothetical protein